AMGLISPGPVVIMGTFAGYLVAGVLGAVVATVAIFTPTYLFVVVPGRVFRRFEKHQRLQGFVTGATAPASGAIAGAAVVIGRERAHSCDAPGAEYTHRDGLCSFEVLVEEYRLDDPGLQLLARIVHGADVSDDRDATPQSRGLLAVAEGFHLLELGDHRQLELSLPVYDALYAWCKNEVSAGRAAA